tara:strand:- start:2844 stop:3179 length:336 start_codon:yes stop_codon:yes gene_type:complete
METPINEWKCGMKIRSKKNMEFIKVNNILTIINMCVYSKDNSCFQVYAVTDSGYFVSTSPHSFSCFKQDQPFSSIIEKQYKQKYGYNIFNQNITKYSHNKAFIIIGPSILY